MHTGKTNIQYVPAKKTLRRSGSAVLVVVLLAAGMLIDSPEAVSQDIDLCGDLSEVTFSDVQEGDYAAEYVRCLGALGISVGLGDGTYGSGEELTRAQMASFLVRLWRDVLGRDCPDGETPFVDVPSDSAHSANISCIYNLGITHGTTPTTFGPDDALTASQISRFLLRLYERTDNSCPDRSDELSEAVDCLEELNVLPETDEGMGDEAVTRDRMAVYVVGLWHNTAGRGVPPPPPTYPIEAAASTSVSSSSTSTTTTSLIEQPDASEALQVLGDLPVMAERRSGYQRSLFRHWSDLDRDGCDTRREILMRDAVAQDSENPPGLCGSDAGSWFSVYDGVWVEFARSLDIDHLVPLAEAWDSGAYNWDAGQRESFANDEDALLAVTAGSNRRKGASDPADWMPSDRDARCPYVSAWIAVKSRWGLSVDTREEAFLRGLLTGECQNTAIHIGTPVLAFPTLGTPTLGTPTLEGTTTTTTLAPGEVPSNPGNSKNCGDFGTQGEAQAWFDRYFPYYGDVARLDGNKDGRACESLPSG